MPSRQADSAACQRPRRHSSGRTSGSHRCRSGFQRQLQRQAVRPTVNDWGLRRRGPRAARYQPPVCQWYYRANRVDHSRCWFLSSSNVSAHSRLRQTASVTRGHFVRPKTGEVPEAQQDRQYGPQIASAIGPAEDRLASGQTIVPEVSTRAQDPLRSNELARAQSRHDPLQTRGGKRATALRLVTDDEASERSLRLSIRPWRPAADSGREASGCLRARRNPASLCIHWKLYIETSKENPFKRT